VNDSFFRALISRRQPDFSAKRLFNHDFPPPPLEKIVNELSDGLFLRSLDPESFQFCDSSPRERFAPFSTILFSRVLFSLFAPSSLSRSPWRAARELLVLAELKKNSLFFDSCFPQKTPSNRLENKLRSLPPGGGYPLAVVFPSCLPW